MKRNKKIARNMRAGKHGYSKAGKKPCQHCQAVTRDSRERAVKGRPVDPVPVKYAETDFAKTNERNRNKRKA
jgi:hypothetical protein